MSLVYIAAAIAGGGLIGGVAMMLFIRWLETSKYWWY